MRNIFFIFPLLVYSLQGCLLILHGTEFAEIELSLRSLCALPIKMQMTEFWNTGIILSVLAAVIIDL
jgi:hypothetical protein